MPALIQPALNPANSPYSYKDNELTYPAVLLHTITFVGGSIWRVSTLPLNPTQSGIPGFTYGGNSYYGYVAKEDLSALQQFNPLGVTIMTSMKVHLFDGDGASSFMELTYGFKGASIVTQLVMWQPGTLNFSTPIPIFNGYCEQAETGDDSNYISVNCKSSLNLARQTAPSFTVSRICSNIFPVPSRQQEAADNPLAPEYGCGYSPTATGGNARGNAGFTTCPLTPEGCKARGMWDLDSSSRITRRFTGSQWNPPQMTRNVSYNTGNKISVFNSPNDAKYGTPLPLQAGTQWIDGKVLNSVGGGDSTRAEVCLFSGDAGAFTNITNNGGLIVVNGVQIQFDNQADKLFTWYFISSGNRTGNFNTIAGYTDTSGNPVSDPYGSQCIICVVVPNSLVNAPAIPSVRAFTLGPINDIRLPNTNNAGDFLTWPTGSTADPVWLVTFLMTQWWGYQWAQFNIASFRACAAKTEALITHIGADGSSSNIQRFRASFAITQARPASDYLDAILNTCNCRLAPNAATGLIDMIMESTLAEQQGSLGTVPYTNYTSPVSSFLMTGAIANGYVAYYFDETSILDGPDGNTTTIKFIPPPSSMQGNKISCKFQDTERNYVEDAITKTDVGALTRNNGVEQVLNYPLFGFDNYDQANRIMSQRLAIVNYGNPSHQPCGTIFISIETSIKGLGIKPLDIILVQLRKYAIGPQLFRVMSVNPQANYGTMEVQAYWHEDVDYIDSNFQSAQPIFSAPGNTTIIIRPPYPLKPYTEVNNSSQYSFACSQFYDTNNAQVPQALLQIYSQVPCNKLSDTVQPPLIARLIGGITVTGSGNVVAGDYVVGICSIDADGNYSAMSGIASVHVASNNSTINIPVIWKNPSVIVKYMAFIGHSEIGMVNASLVPVTVSGSPPSTVSISALPVNHLPFVGPYPGFGPPDGKFAQLQIDTRIVSHPGTVTGRITALALVSGNTVITMTQDYGPWTVNAYFGMEINLAGRAGISGTGSGQCPVIRAFVTANDAGTGPRGFVHITVTGDYTVTGATPFMLQDIVYIDAQVDSATTDTITCALFDNGGLVAHGEIGNSVIFLDAPATNREYPIKDNTATTITCTVPFEVTLTTGVRFIIVSRTITSKLTAPGLNNNPNYTTAPLIAEVAVDNPAPSITTLRDSFLYVVIYTLDSDGKFSFETQAPWRLLWIFGDDTVTGAGGVSDAVYGPNGGTTYPVKGDAIYPQAMFGLTLSPRSNDDGSVTPIATVNVLSQASVLSTLIPAPVLGTITQSAIGGSIIGGFTYYIAIAAVDINGVFSNISIVTPVTIASGTANQITIPVSNYVAGMTSYLIYVGTNTSVGLYYRRSNSASASVTLTTLLSTTGESYPTPDPNFTNFVVSATVILLDGIFGGAVGAESTITAVVSSAGNHYKLILTGAAFTTSALIGRVVCTIVQGPMGNPTPMQNYTITANDATSVTVVALPASGLFNGPTFNTGDQVMIRLKADIFTGDTIGDSMLAMGSDDYKGKVVTVTYKSGYNQTAFITTNDATTLTLQTPLTGPIGDIATFWIEDSATGAAYPSNTVAGSDNSAPVDIAVPIYNYKSFQAFRVFAAALDGNVSPAPFSPVRDGYWKGSPGTGATSYTIAY